MVLHHSGKKLLRGDGGVFRRVALMPLMFIFAVITILILPGFLEQTTEATYPPSLTTVLAPTTTRESTQAPSGSFDRYLDCLAARISVDRHTATEYPFPNDNISIPYIVLPVTVEEPTMISLMCNLTVHIRRLVYVQNGSVPSMTAFLDAVMAAFHSTRRVRVMRKRGNFGYATALNMALRDFLQLPFDEAPFFFMANNDVLLPGGMMEKALPLFYSASREGRDMLDALEAEVATEPNEHTPQRFRDVPLRSTDARHALVTSRLLPDRIRYQSLEQRRTAFAGFYGDLYPDTLDQTAFWAVTRLALEVTGYFDENCYPAYHEDTDMIERLRLLGFKALRVSGWEETPVLHIVGGSQIAALKSLALPMSNEAQAFLKGSRAIIHRLFSTRYESEKCRSAMWCKSTKVAPSKQNGMPLDAFVIYQQRVCTIEQLEEQLIDRLLADPSISYTTAIRMLVNAEQDLGNIDRFLIDGTSYYRNGSTLRLLTDCAALLPTRPLFR
ncbi:hypothetical protein NXY56_006440 [Leishmania guyanensis]|uniref:Putative beta galactofuranosyl glycosyle transferase n=1 Tax=Leishmania guyanensis TaxID=5670 RepID=A0A1E1IUD7_LEIGU|nr:Putative beta galactofuranosyl glycosyle transferase [Leishmania guyanensis]